MSNERIIYPFTAIVGQEKMKQALLLNAINPTLGGVLIRGEKGTAKSTAVRALADLLLEVEQIATCPFSCDPHDKNNMCESCLNKIENGEKIQIIKDKMKVVNLPVSATEDRVVGTLDIEYAIKKGEKRFEPGILARANRNILYVDEVNLLDDHVVDVLLDSAAMGINTVEREGVSYTHPAKFILVGTMNPEEGDLRPQLLDRFGLAVDVKGESATQKRVKVVKRRIEFEAKPEQFKQKYTEKQANLTEKIMQAKSRLPQIIYDQQILELTARISLEIGVDGHRADINMIKTAMTIAAFAERTQLIADDIIEAAALVLPHRIRRKPFAEGKLEFSVIEEMIDQYSKRCLN